MIQFKELIERGGREMKEGIKGEDKFRITNL